MEYHLRHMRLMQMLGQRQDPSPNNLIEELNMWCFRVSFAGGVDRSLRRFSVLYGKQRS
jgi:hypothetical protein